MYERKIKNVRVTVSCLHMIYDDIASIIHIFCSPKFLIEWGLDSVVYASIYLRILVSRFLMITTVNSN